MSTDGNTTKPTGDRPVPKMTIGTRRGRTTPPVDLSTTAPKKLEVVNSVLSVVIGRKLGEPPTGEGETPPVSRLRSRRVQTTRDRSQVGEMGSVLKGLSTDGDVPSDGTFKAGEAFSNELARCKKLLNELVRLKADDGPAGVVISAAEDLAKDGTEKGFKDGFEVLKSSFDGAYSVAKGNAEEATEFTRGSEEAERLLKSATERLSAILKASDRDTTDVSEALDTARQLLSGATKSTHLPVVTDALEHFDTLAQEVEKEILAVASAKEAWTKARAEAAQALSDTRALPGAATCAAVRVPGDAIEASIRVADLAAAPASADAYRAAKQVLKDVAGEATKAAKASEAAASANSKLIGARGAIAALAPFRWIDASAAQGLLDTGRDALDKAAEIGAINGASVTLGQALAAAQELARSNEVMTGSARTTEADLKKAESIVRSLQGVYDYGPLINEAADLLTEVGKARKAVTEAANPGAVVEAARAAVALRERAERARSLSAEGVKTVTALGAALDKLKKVEALGYVDLTEAKRVLGEAEVGVSRATDLGQANLAAAPLAGFDALLERAVKAAAPAGEKRKVYLEARRSAEEQLASVLRMNGATPGSGLPADPRIGKIVQQIQNRLNMSASIAAGGTVDAYTNALGLIEGLDAKVKEAEKASTEVQLKAKADFKAQGDYYIETLKAEKALARIAELPGQEAARNEVALLMAKARGLIKADGPFVRGHAEALALLTDPTTGPLARLKKAIEDENERTKDATYDGEVLGAHRAALGPLVSAYERDALLTEIDYRDYRRQLQGALELALLTKDQDPTDAANKKAEALKRILAVETAVAKEASEVKPLKITARNYLDAFESEFLNPLEAIAPASVVAAARGEIERIKTVEVRANAWRAASDRLSRLRVRLGGQLDAYKASSVEWAEALIELDERLKEGEPLVAGWPERAGVIAGVLPAIRVLKSSVADSRDYDAGVAAADELLDRYDEAYESVTKAVDPGTDLDALCKIRAKSDKQVKGFLESTQKEFDAFAQTHLAGVRNRDALPPYKFLADAVGAWRAFLADPKPTGSNDIDQEFKAQIKSLFDLVTAARKALTSLSESGDRAIAQTVQGAKDADAREDDRARPAAVQAKLVLLAQRGGDPAPFRDRLGPPNDLKEVEKEIDAAIQKIADDMAKRVARGRERIADISKAVRFFQGSEQTFKAYYEGVRDEAADIDALFQSGDPDLVDLAERQADALVAKFRVAEELDKDGKIATLIKKLRGVAPTEGPEEPKFGDVQTVWADIAFNLGGSTFHQFKSFVKGVPRDTYVMDRMPVTYKALSDRAVSDVAKSKAMAPLDAVNFLAPLAADCAKAAKDSVALQAEYDRFKEVSGRVEEMLERMVADTATVLVFGKVDVSALEAKLSTQLADAKTLAKTEGQLPAAFERLATITTELEGLKNAPDPRAALLKADAAAKREQAAVLNLCRQYEGHKDLFNTAYGAAEFAVEQAKGDATQVTELKRLGDTADRVVKPYTVLRENALKKIGSNPSPPMDKVNQAFAQARSTLDQGIAGARRVINYPAGTNVEVTGDLDAVEAEWVRRANQFASSVLALAGEIESTVKGDETNGPKVSGVVSPLVNRLRGLSGKFPAQAFTGPLATLRTEKDKAKRKAARELALKEVRRMTAELTKDPLVQSLCKYSNPFRTQVNAPASQLRAGLKSVEREVLVGV